MKIHTLIQKLQEFDPDMELLLQSDHDGNIYHDIWDIEIRFMNKEGYEWMEASDDDYSERMLIIYP